MNNEHQKPLQQLIEQLFKKLQSIEFRLDDLQSIDDWVDEETAKRLTGLGKSTLYSLRKEGKLTSSRLSKRKVFYRISDLSRLLDENEKTL